MPAAQPISKRPVMGSSQRTRSADRSRHKLSQAETSLHSNRKAAPPTPTSPSDTSHRGRRRCRLQRRSRSPGVSTHSTTQKRSTVGNPATKPPLRAGHMEAQTLKRGEAAHGSPAQGPLAGLIRLSSRQSASCSGGHRKDICSVEPWNCGDAVTWTIAAASCALDHPALQSLIRLIRGGSTSNTARQRYTTSASAPT